MVRSEDDPILKSSAICRNMIDIFDINYVLYYALITHRRVNVDPTPQHVAQEDFTSLLMLPSDKSYSPSCFK
uniref:Uncharacterized protein n=1 Tax=Physcomitrium patens TaxID=3218 RepID=A0A2K1IPC7_PHYPA|nr:hypothetical protein PHYPA_027424 [Physcomitrium patens]